MTQLLTPGIPLDMRCYRVTTARWSVRVPLSLCAMLLAVTAGCRDLAGTQPLPAGVIAPSNVQTAAGAAALAVAAKAQFQYTLGWYVPVSGVMTDELTADGRGSTPNGSGNFGGSNDVFVDARLLSQDADWSKSGSYASTDAVYGYLQQVRAFTRQAIAALTTYAPTTSQTEQGEMYALMGYADVMLADLFCTGIPLSTLDFQGDYTYQPGSTTTQVYTQAIALFDTAMVLAADSASILNLARVGQARAYLALGQYAAAGQAVSQVPSTFRYVDSLYTCEAGGDIGFGCPNASATSSSGASVVPTPFFNLPQDFGVSDREGSNGLPFVSSGDPRTTSIVIGNTQDLWNTPISADVRFPTKYNMDGISALVVASGLEAQLITAEAELNTGNASGAFAIMNALRTSSPVTSGQLPALTDPGTFSAEVDTLFTERAAWLFVDGHRQGDLRRLVRQYGKQQGVTVVANGYPTQGYPYFGAYGPYIDAPIPPTELYNPLFTGCLGRD